MSFLPESVKDAIRPLYPSLVARQALVRVGLALFLCKGPELDLKCLRTGSKQNLVVPKAVPAGDQNSPVGK